MSGERDWTEIAKEVSMSLTTIYNVTGELTKLGQPLAIHQRYREVATSTFAQPTHRTH